jgi:uroporphyrin-III C-methyltransferase
VLVVENASLPHERRALTTLAAMGDALRGWDGPALLVIGEVAALADVDGVVRASEAHDLLGRRA